MNCYRLYSLCFTVILSFLFSQEECDGFRYQEEIFQDSEIQVISNIQYGENVNTNFWGTEINEELLLDVYLPTNDILDSRPLIIFLYGGSFISGSKESPDIVELCMRYAKMGYVTSAINYRLTPTLILQGTEENAYKAVMKGIHDLKAAVRYFRMDDEIYNSYDIDAERIYAGGVSAGAIAAVNGAYLNLESEIPPLVFDYVMNDVGGIEGESGNQEYDSSYSGIINLCGAVKEYTWIVEGDIPIVSAHGDQDTVVPYSDNLVTLFGLDLQVYGSYIINETMNNLGNMSELLTYEGIGHTPFISSSYYMDITIDFTKSFMHDLVCYTDSVPGDTNNDGEINILDVVILVNIIISGDYSDQNLLIADLNSDGAINILDVVLLVNLVLYE